MNDTTRKILPGKIYQEVSRDPDVVRRRIKEAGAGPDIKEAKAKAKKTGEVVSVEKISVKGSRLIVSLFFVVHKTGELTSFTLTGKKSQAFRMKGVLKAISEKFGAME